MRIRSFRGDKYQADAGLINGKRLRQVFNSKKAAETWLRAHKETKRKFRLGLRALDVDQAADALAGLQILDGRATLVDAARFWKEHHKYESTRKLEDTITAFIEHLRARDSRKRYIDSIEDTLLAFKREVGNVTLADCSIERIREWLSKPEWSKATFRNRRRELSVFFNWCFEAQGYIGLNPVARIPSPKLRDRQITVLKPEQAKKLLNGIHGRDRAYFALSLFSGLRANELDRLVWDDLKLERGFIEVLGENAKSGSRRLIKIQSNLLAWLKPLVQSAEEPIFRGDKYELMCRACAACGLEEWPQNVCRHSFGSYHLAHFRDMNETAMQMGHTSTSMLFRHYREVVTVEDAARYWAIVPESKTEGYRKSP